MATIYYYITFYVYLYIYYIYIEFLHFIFFCSLGRVPDVVHPLFIFLLLNFIIIQTQSIRDWKKKGCDPDVAEEPIYFLFDKNQTRDDLILNVW